MKIYKYFFLIIFLFYSFNVNAINKYNLVIEDNKFIDQEVVFSLLEDFDQNLDDNEIINQLGKKLYETGNFKKVDIVIKNDDLIINLKEYSSISQIKFIDNERFKKEQLLELYNQSIDKKYFNTILIDRFVNEVEDLYRSFGYNQINLTYEAKPTNDENIVDLFFYFDEGKISKINKIFFEGNNNFKRAKLLNLTSSKPRRELLFFLKKSFKEHVYQNDANRLIKFYKNKGFKDVKVQTKTEYIESKNKFNLYFIISEGQKYEFNTLDVLINSNNINDEEIQAIDNLVNKFKKDLNKKPIYNTKVLFNIKSELSNFLFDLGLNFFQVSILEKVDETKVDILLEISDLRPTYVNQIIISGNNMTQDKVIRREIEFAEGDPINENLINASIKNLKSLGFFKSVEIEEIQKDNNTVDILVDIEEQKSGDFSVGLSFSSLEGATFISKLDQKNIAGSGKSIDLSINTSSNNTEYAFAISEPRFFNNKIKFNYGLNYNFRDYSTESSYKISKTTASTGIEFELRENLTNSIDVAYEINNYEITDNSTVSSNILSSEGTNTLLKFNNTLDYSNLDSFLRPTSGNNFNLSSTISPITNSNDGFIKNTFTLRKFMSYENYIFSIQSRLGNIISLQNDEISDNQKYALGGRWLRGFDVLGAGPRNSRTSYVGGNNLFVTKFDLSRTLVGNTDNPIDIFIFADVGTVFDNKTKPTNSDESIRSSVGYGFKIYSPIGPIGLSWGFPVADESYDIKREFLFSIGNIN